MTLQELYDKNPKWRNLPLTVYSADGILDHVGGEFGAGVYEGVDENDQPVIVFTAN